MIRRQTARQDSMRRRDVLHTPYWYGCAERATARARRAGRRSHILPLTDRDWTSPGRRHRNQSVRAGLTLGCLGHRVTVIAGSTSAPSRSPARERLTILRMGGRDRVPARGVGDPARRGPRRRRGAEVNGIAFTPLWFWLKAPRVTLVHHYKTTTSRDGPGRWIAAVAPRCGSCTGTTCSSPSPTAPATTWWSCSARRPRTSTSPGRRGGRFGGREDQPRTTAGSSSTSGWSVARCSSVS